MSESSKIGRDLNIVPFVSVDHMMKIVESIGMESTLKGIAAYVEEDWHETKILLAHELDNLTNESIFEDVVDHLDNNENSSLKDFNHRAHGIVHTYDFNKISSEQSDLSG